MKDHWLVYTDADEAIVAFDESDAIKLAHEYEATLVAKVCPSDRLWVDVTEDLAATDYAANGPQGAYPKCFVEAFGREEYSYWAQQHGKE